MTRTLSTRWTFFIKIFLPAIWIPGFAAGVIIAFQHPESVIYNGVRGAAPAGIGFQFLFAWIMGSAFMLFAGVRLKRVRVADGSLLVSNFVSEWRVPFSLISEVFQSRLLFDGKPIIIRLREDIGCGRTVTFLPLFRWRFRHWKQDPFVNELRQLAELPDRLRN
ncbi:MAG TPA: hypothetical protein VIM15_03100 [Gemmatimonadaceae bacterium]